MNKFYNVENSNLKSIHRNKIHNHITLKANLATFKNYPVVSESLFLKFSQRENIILFDLSGASGQRIITDRQKYSIIICLIICSSQWIVIEISKKNRMTLVKAPIESGSFESHRSAAPKDARLRIIGSVSSKVTHTSTVYSQLQKSY
jgi:hypothetical protein